MPGLWNILNCQVREAPKVFDYGTFEFHVRTSLVRLVLVMGNIGQLRKIKLVNENLARHQRI